MKRFLTAILGVIMIFTMLAPSALAMNATEALPAQQEIVKNAVRIWGAIQDVDLENSRVEVALGDSEGSVILNITENTYIVDDVSHQSVALADLQIGSILNAWHSPAMTRSLPPQTNAIALVVNIPMDKMPGQFFEIEKVERTKQGYRFLNQEQDLFVTVPFGTKAQIFDTKKYVNVSTLKPGSKLIVWYQIVALSYPGQTGTSELIVFPFDYTGSVSIEHTSIKVNGAKLAKKAIIKDEISYIPLRDVARKLGFRASLDTRRNTLTLKKGTDCIIVKAGKEVFTKNGEEIATKAPFAQNKVLYAPAELIDFLGNIKLAQPKI